MRPDVDVEVIFVALVTEQRVRLRQHAGVHEVCEALQLALFGSEPPGVEIQIESVVVHDVLLETVDARHHAPALDAVEPRVVAPAPDHRRHQIGQHKAVHEIREYEHLHVGERHRR